MSDQATIRHLARAVADELANRHYVASAEEAAAVLEASRPDPGARCVKCGSRVSPSQSKCDMCGETRAIPNTTRLACKECGAPVNAEWSTCSRCGSGQAKIVRQDPQAPLECVRCGHPIYSVDEPECPECGETRCVRRGQSGTPIATVIS